MWTAVKSIFVVLLAKTNNRPIIGRYRLLADNRCTSTVERLAALLTEKCPIWAMIVTESQSHHSMHRAHLAVTWPSLSAGRSRGLLLLSDNVRNWRIAVPLLAGRAPYTSCRDTRSWNTFHVRRVKDTHKSPCLDRVAQMTSRHRHCMAMKDDSKITRMTDQSEQETATNDDYRPTRVHSTAISLCLVAFRIDRVVCIIYCI